MTGQKPSTVARCAGGEGGAALARGVVVCSLMVCSLMGVLPGCATWPVEATDPQAMTVPSGWLHAGAPASDVGPPDPLGAWWQRFDDPALARWVHRAQEGSPRVAAATAAWRAALAQRDAAAAARGPTLDASASALGEASGTGATRRNGQRWQLGLDARWDPDLAGATGSGLAAALAVVRAREADLGDVQVQLAAEVAQTYIALRAQQARLRLAEATLASQRQTLQITDWRHMAGLVSVLELDRARAAVAQTEALLPALQTAIAQGRHALASLAGLPPAAGDDALDAASQPRPELPAAPEGLALDIPAQTLRQRADVQAAEREITAALWRLNQSEARRLPRFALDGAIGLSALSLRALGQGAALAGSVLASVQWPVFDAGAGRAQVQLQRAALEQAQAQYRSAVLLALQQVEDTLVALQGNRLRLDALRRAADAAVNAATLARQRFESGLVDFQVVLDTQRTAFSAQDAVLDARADAARLHVQLYRALGGGWQDAPLRTTRAGPP